MTFIDTMEEHRACVHKKIIPRSAAARYYFFLDLNARFIIIFSMKEEPSN